MGSFVLLNISPVVLIKYKLANNTMIEVYYLWIKLFINDIIISQLRKSLFTLCKMDEYKF